MKNSKPKAKKPVKKAKRSQKEVDLSKIPEKFPDGNVIPQWVREMYATGKLPQTLIAKKEQPDASPASPDTRVTDAEQQMPDEIWQEEGQFPLDQVNQHLKDFYRSNAFKAYKQYIGSRLQIVSDALHTTDPVKDPTAMARQQGIRLGLIDLEGYIISLIELEKEKTNRSQQ